MAGHKEVIIEHSKLKFALAKILEKEGFVESVVMEKTEKGEIKIKLRYYLLPGAKKMPAITGLKRISKAGQRIYIKGKDIKRVKNKLGIAIISTSKGIMTGEESRKLGLGGEYLCEVW